MMDFKSVILLFVFFSVPLGLTQAQERINEQALHQLRLASEQSHSSAVLVVKDGRTIVDWNNGEPRPIEVMSVLKSIVALGMGRLIQLKKIESLDQPVHEFYPEWNQGRKKEITIRHLLNHTSGIQDFPSAGVEIYPSPDAVKLSLAAELSEDPGSAFRYNNKATNLLAGIIAEASGQRMDQFFGGEFFRSMEIHTYKWYFDKSGSPHAMAGLELYARDLAKFGQLVLDDGMWQGQAFIPKAFIHEMLESSQPHYPLCGLLWWRLPTQTRYILDKARLAVLAEAGVATSDLDRLRPLVGRVLTTRESRNTALQEVFGEDWRHEVSKRFPTRGEDPVFRREHGPIVAYYADGYLGQTLMVVPEHGLVAVRQIRGGSGYNTKTDGFRNFKQLVLNLVTPE